MLRLSAHLCCLQYAAHSALDLETVFVRAIQTLGVHHTARPPVHTVLLKMFYQVSSIVQTLAKTAAFIFGRNKTQQRLPYVPLV